jgi:hypothetical protein
MGDIKQSISMKGNNWRETSIISMIFTNEFFEKKIQKNLE